MRVPLAIVAYMLFAVGLAPCFAQEALPNASVRKGSVALVSLSNPAYPALARMARISGEVQLRLNIRSDGTVESASVLSGHPMLHEAALKSA